MNRNVRRVAGLTALALVFAACGDDTAVTTTIDSPSAATTTTVAFTSSTAGATTTAATTTTGGTTTTATTTTEATTTSRATTTTAATTTTGATTTTAASTTSTTTATTVTKIDVSGLAFHPASVTVAKGTTVKWRNNDAVAHTTTGSGWNGNLASGASFSLTFSTPGTYAYHCNIHPSMTGTITVTG